MSISGVVAKLDTTIIAKDGAGGTGTTGTSGQLAVHTRQAKELAASFLQQIESEGYEGFAIIGVPNREIESRFATHVDQCEECRAENEQGGVDFCDEGHDAMFEDDGFENVFVLKSRYAGEIGEYGLGELLDAAEPYRPETDHKQVKVELDNGKRIEVDSGLTDLILQMNFPGLFTSYSCQGTTFKDAEESLKSNGYRLNPCPGYVSFSGMQSKRFAQILLQEMLANNGEESLAGITFEHHNDVIVMRWHPCDLPKLLRYVTAARQTLYSGSQPATINTGSTQQALFQKSQAA